ncbi:MAG: PASTA domain-containing protein, partial [Clostridia bacterium]|nr:PASTA domain-containing protein [Clostridia bacterium]
KIMEDTLRYLDIEPQYSEEEKQSLDVFVPDVKGLSKENAIKNLTSESLNYRIVGNGQTVKDQMPTPGSTLSANSVVIIYTEDSTTSKVAVPDVTNLSLSEVQARLSDNRLNLAIAGAAATGNTSYRTVASSQTPAPGAEVDEGTIVEVEFRFLDVD